MYDPRLPVALRCPAAVVHNKKVFVNLLREDEVKAFGPVSDGTARAL